MKYFAQSVLFLHNILISVPFFDVSFDFDTKINCFVGKNGIGKTNVLDAIYYLAYGKSYFNPQAVQNIKHGEEFFVIDGTFEKDGRSEQIVCSLKKGQKKVLKRNNKQYEKFSDHIGFIPLVIISPSDRDLITEGSETRRKFIDIVISQLDSTYLQSLISYQKTLVQRNALLKYFAINRLFDAETLAIYDEQLSLFGTPIFEKRQQFLEEFIPIFNKHHHSITNSAENVNLVYESSLHGKSLLESLKENLDKDKMLQYTSSGQKPILLFDDIFDKLDEERVSKIVEMVNQETFGQLFISDTHSTRTEDIVKSSYQTYKIFNL